MLTGCPKVKSLTSQGGTHDRSQSRLLQHEATESTATPPTPPTPPPLGGMLVPRSVIPRSMLSVTIYTPGWRETMWGKVSCLRKQHDGRDWASNH